MTVIKASRAQIMALRTEAREADDWGAGCAL
jgi:hypothetical protein